MNTSTVFDTFGERVAAGERLSPDEIRALATTPDVLSLGMLADTVRRRLHAARVTFLRVTECAFDAPCVAASKTREIRITGSPGDLAAASGAAERARTVVGDGTVSGFSWEDIERLALGESVARVLTRLRDAGLDGLAHLPLDRLTDSFATVNHLANAGFRQLRLTIDKAPAEGRTDLLLHAAELQQRFACIQALNPLPLTLTAFKPTTGYEDVKMVAVARLAAPNIPTIQVDWRRYGPKLAQVALSFGADDLDGVSASDEAPEGRRRAPLEEIRRNIEAAGFEAAERDGRFIRIA